MATNTNNRKRSLVHTYFTSESVLVGNERDGPDGIPMLLAKCTLCSAALKVAHGNTSSLRHHLQSKHKAEYFDMTACESTAKKLAEESVSTQNCCQYETS